MYTLFGYGNMIADTDRMDAYAKALSTRVKPGDVVVDIGTGTGICALLACKLGARKVYAIEANPLIEVAKLAAKENNCGEKIEFIADVSLNVNLPDRADVIVSDLRGILPLFQQHIPSIIDARERFLVEGGTMIPWRDRLWAAPVDAPELYRVYNSPWLDSPYDLNLESARRFLIHCWQKCSLKPERCVLPPQIFATLDYPAIASPNLKATLQWQAEKAAQINGLCLWFDTILAEGISFSNAPGERDRIYGKAFLPWQDPVEIAAGDTIICDLQANLVGDDYIWQWHSRVMAGGEIKANFKQSTFYAQPLSLPELKKRSPEFVPQLNNEGKILRLVLDLMDRERSLEAIARECDRLFPHHFSSWDKTLDRVREWVKLYGR